MAATSASRYVSRASSVLSGSRRLAALRSSRAASPPRCCSNAICPRKCSTWAVSRASSGPASTATNSPSAASSAPASRFALAAANRRCARRDGFGRQHRRALEERGRCRQAPAALRAPGRALELLGNVLVRPRGSVGPMPGTAVGIDIRIGDLREDAVRLLSLPKRRRPVGRRAHKRMTKPHPRVELDQSGLDGGRRSLGTDRQPLGSSPQQHGVADGIGRCELQQPPRLGRKRIQPSPEALLDPPRKRYRVRKCEPARQLSRRQTPRQLQQSQRVAARLAHDRSRTWGSRGPVNAESHQSLRVDFAQALDHEL